MRRTHNDQAKRMSLPGRMVGTAGLILLLLLLGSSIGFAQEDPALARQVRAIEPDELGITRPAGLAFSTAANDLYVLEAREPGRSPAVYSDITVLSASPVSDQTGMVRVLAAVPDPINMAFDSKASRLLLFQPGKLRLIEIATGPDGELEPMTLAYHDVPRFGVRSPRGMTVDPATGQLYILDGIGPRLVRVEPDLDGGFENAAITRLDLVDVSWSGLRGLALDPATGHLYTLSPAEQTLYEVTQAGRIIASHDVSSLGLRDPQGLSFAPTGDLTDDPSLTSLYIADSGLDAGLDEQTTAQTGGRIVELALDEVEPRAITADVSASLVNTIDTSAFNPPSPDSAGIIYYEPSGTLLMTDSEVDEMPIYFTGDNVFEMTLDGTLLRTGTTLPYVYEPSGVTYNPADNHAYIADDGTRRIWEIDPGSDGLPFTPDDPPMTNFRTAPFGCTDAEGITFDTWNDVLFLVDGLNKELYRVAPGPNGVFDGVPPDGDDVVTHWDTESLGMLDPGGLTFDEANGYLYMVGSPRNLMAELKIDGTDSLVLVRMIDISAADPRVPAGLTVAPSTADPRETSIYLAARGIDNNTDPLENDGKVYELYVPAHSADVVLNKSMEPAVASAGDIITFTLSFYNAGSNTARGVVITDTIPAELTVQSVYSSGVSIENSEEVPPYVWYVQDLSTDAQGFITITAEVDAGLSCFDSFENMATIATTSVDTRPGNDSSSVIVAAGAGVSVDPTSASKSGDQGADVVYNLQVTNEGTCQDTFEISVGGTAWDVTVQPTVGPLNAGAHQNVQVTVHVPSDAPCGPESAIITFTSANAGSVSASSELITTASTVYGVAVGPPGDSLSGFPGDELAYTLWMVNTGNCIETFDVAASEPSWVTDFPSTVGPVYPGLAQVVPVIVTVPLDALAIDVDIATMTFASQSDSTKSGTSVLNTTVGVVYGVAVDPSTAIDGGDPNTSVLYTLTVTNTGNSADTFSIVTSSDTWSASALPTEVTLDPDEPADVQVSVAVPWDAQCGEQDITTTTFTSLGNGTISASSILTTSANTVHQVSVVPPAPPATPADAGSQVVHTLYVLNEGNCTDIFDVTASGTDWPVETQFTEMELLPGILTSINITVTVPLEAQCGPEVATVTFTSQYDATASDSSILTTSVNPVYGVLVDALSDTGSADPGSPVGYTLSVTNDGNCADTFSFSVSGNAWTTTAPDVGPLQPGASTDVDVTVTVDPGALCDEQDTATVTFTSNDGTTSASSALTTSANTVYGVMVEASSAALSGDPGTDVDYVLWVTNTGNCAGTFIRSITGNVWSVTSVPSVALDPDEFVDVDVAVAVPACTAGGVSDTATVTFVSQAPGTGSDSVDLTTTANHVAPSAGDDEYNTTKDVPLVVAASGTPPGVLENDSDGNCDELTVSQYTQPSDGTVVVDADGSFTYTPAPNFDGIDTFTYHAFDGGLSDSATVTINVASAGDELVVDAGPDQPAVGDPPIEEGDTVSFAGSFVDPARTLAAGESIYWDFGDGGSATGTLTPDHTYLDDDEYTVTLTITDPEDNVGQDSLLVTVLNVAPVVNAGPDRTVNPGDVISFSGIYTDTVADTHTIQWDMGDDTIINGMLAFDHTYESGGFYTVTLTVTDDDGGVGTDAAIIRVGHSVYLPVIFRVFGP